MVQNKSSARKANPTMMTAPQPLSGLCDLVDRKISLTSSPAPETDRHVACLVLKTPPGPLEAQNRGQRGLNAGAL